MENDYNYITNYHSGAAHCSIVNVWMTLDAKIQGSNSLWKNNKNYSFTLNKVLIFCYLNKIH